MKVVHLTCVYPPYGGGIGTIAQRYAAELTAEHQVTVMAPKYHPGTSYQQMPGVDVHPVKPFLAFGNAAYINGIRHKLRGYDVVHLHYPFFGVHEFLSKLPLSQKLVISYHMTPFAEGWKGKVFAWDTKRYGPRLARRAQLMIAATHDYLEGEAIPQFGQSGVWRILPYGVPDSYQPGESPEQLERELKLRYGEHVFLFVGTLDAAHAFKGLDVLLRALKRLPENASWRLVVAGGGNKRHSFEALANTLGLKKKVNFTGYVPEKKLPDYYRLAHTFVFPSTSKAESFGLVALQAMATGIPVVASRLTGVQELVRHGETGLLVPPNDDLALAAALEQIMKNPAESRQMGRRAFEIVQAQYRWGVIGAKLREMYRELA